MACAQKRAKFGLILRQSDQARANLCAISDDLELIKSQRARLPTQKELARTGLLVVLTTAALVLVGFEVLFRRAALALLNLPTETIEADRYPLSPRIQTFREHPSEVRRDGTRTTTAGATADAGGTNPREGAASRTAAAEMKSQPGPR
jgi:hypothetical protein